MSDYGDRSQPASHFNRRQSSNPFLASQSQGAAANSADGVRQEARRDAQSAPQQPATAPSADPNPKTTSERTPATQTGFNLSRWLKNPPKTSYQRPNAGQPNAGQPNAGQSSPAGQPNRYLSEVRLPTSGSAPEIRRRPQPPQFSANPSAKNTAAAVSRSRNSPRQTSFAPPSANQSRQSPALESRASQSVKSGVSKPGASTVAPIRPEQVWPPSETRRRSRDRRPPQHLRRPKKSAPRPLLYMIRLLILGIGMAAIIGTLLAILRPEPQFSQSARSQASRPALQTSSRSRQAALALSLPLANELVYLKQDIEELVTMTPGLSQSVFVLDLDTGNYVDVAGSEALPAASTIKTPILVAFLQDVDAGLFRLDQAMTLQAEHIAGGSGDMQGQPLGTEYTVWQVASQMIINSDNTATNMMINLLGGPRTLNQRFQSWGLAATVIRNPLPDLEGTNTTSTRDLASLMALVNRGELLSLRSRDRLLAIMQRTRTRTLIPSGVGKGAVVANKTGDIASVLGDMALVDAPNGTRYAIAALIRRPHNDGRARELIRRISQLTFKELNRTVPPAGKAELVPVVIPDRGEGGAP